MTDIPAEWLRGEPLTTAQVASVFNVSQPTVVRWAKTGKIGFFLNPNGDRRYPECEIMRIANSGEISEEAVELARQFNQRLRERWEGGYRQNAYMARQAGLYDKPEGTDG